MLVLSSPTKHCMICFQEIKDNSFHNLIDGENVLCEECFSKFNPRFIHFHVRDIKGMAIYEYDQTIKELLFKFKGCYDIELKDVFLARYLWFLRIKYRGYYIVPVPSFELDDKKRGFNHVIEIYSGLKFPVLNILKKVENHKQAKQTRKQRISSQKNFTITNLDAVNNKKILIVDDVYTTGSSMNAAINLVMTGKPKKIEVLVIAKNVLHKNK